MTKIEQLTVQIKDKKIQIENLDVEIQSLEESIQLLKSEQYNKMLKRADDLLGKYYLYFRTQDYKFAFCYCDKIAESSDGAGLEITLSSIAIDKVCGYLSYSENYTVTITYEGYFDNTLVLNGEQAKEIQDAIDKTLHREQTTKDLYNYIDEFYKTNNQKIN